MDPLGPTAPLLSVILDATAQRQRLIAQNLVNADVPHYHAQDLSFDAALRHAADGGDPDEIRDSEFGVVERPNPAKLDGNTVDMEQEIAEAGKNSLVHQVALTIVTLKTHQLRSAIAGHSV